MLNGPYEYEHYALEFDNRGKLQSSAAKEWGTEDGGQTWTFKLRDDGRGLK